jgi:hypothetical protein
MQQQHLRATGFKPIDDLPDLVRRRRAEITRPNEAHALKVDPRAAPALGRPGFQDRSLGAKSRGEQEKQFVVGEVIQPGRVVGIQEGFVVVASDGNDGNVRRLGPGENFLSLPQMRRFDLRTIEQVADQEEGVRFRGDGLVGDEAESIGKVCVRQTSVEAPPPQMDVRRVDQFDSRILGCARRSLQYEPRRGAKESERRERGAK